MDSAEPMSQNDSECQILNILKAVLFVVVSAFVLYVPLGDPQVACETIASAQNRKIAYCCICEAYAIAVKIVTQLIETIKFVACLLMDLLYEAKLGIYGFLDKVDRNDICKSVCCNANSEHKDKIKELRCPLCKCVRSRCRSDGDCR